MGSPPIDIGCDSGTRIQVSNSVVQVTAPNVSSRYFLGISGDGAPQAVGQHGVEIILSGKVKAAFLNWFPVSSHLCAVNFRSRLKFESLVVLSATCLSK